MRKRGHCGGKTKTWKKFTPVKNVAVKESSETRKKQSSDEVMGQRDPFSAGIVTEKETRKEGWENRQTRDRKLDIKGIKIQ